MDERFVRLYRKELLHIREMGAEFARENPKIAGRLGMEGIDCADPYVERLLEGFAFLTARIQLKMEAEFPRLTQHIFEKSYPQYLCPMPAMAIVQLHPNLVEGDLSQGPIVPKGSLLNSMYPPESQTRCGFTTAHEVALWPLEIVDAQYHTRDLSSLDLKNYHGAKAALRIRLKITADLNFSELNLDRLVIHIRGAEGVGSRIYEQLMTHTRAIAVHSKGRPPSWVEELPSNVLREYGFEDEQALLPVCAQSFQGYRLLQEYFVLPERFLFFELRDLRHATTTHSEKELDITILLGETDIELDGVISADNFKLGCTPIVNLFERKLDRIHLTDEAFEYHLVPDRTAPLDYEVHSITQAKGYGAHEEGGEQTFESFYAARDVEPGVSPGFYALHRTPRAFSERERKGIRRSSHYAGSEVFISLVDTNAAPYDTSLRQLGVTARCTNRDLPIHIPIGVGETDFTLDIGLPIRSIRCLGSIVPPKPTPPEGEHSWRLISHLTPNYVSILDTEGGDAGEALREILGLYSDLKRPELRRQIEGIRGLSSKPILRRIHEGGPIAFARGLEVTLTVDEYAFEGIGAFLLSSVLNRFFSRYVTMNVFTELVLNSLQRGVVKRWPLMAGRQNNL
ncbi:MAG: type VI secretion system baseplate subunit TssF [Planctomycetota bacterium]|nr:type VI secretion system baseplate subunit TssF [Planctomycetota bacterium]